jgi:hypothetical protein
VVGLMADPGAAAEIARRLARELPGLLERRIGRPRESWRVDVAVEPFTAGEDLPGVIDRMRRAMDERGWDLAICLTDLPLRSNGDYLVADVSAADGIALVSLPSLGGVLLHRRARRATVELLAELVEAGPDGGDQIDHVLGEPTAPWHRTETGDEVVDARFLASRVRGRMRLLVGMVRANRPWLLVPSLAGAFAAALATSAIATINTSVWLVSDNLGAARLTLASIGSAVLMVAWLIIKHELWEQPAAQPDGEIERVALYNATTILTLALGVGIAGVTLFAVNLLAALFIVDPDAMRTYLRHPVDLGTHLKLAWLATSAATVGGALGSGLDSDQAVRRAAYGKRERQRRAALRKRSPPRD